MIRRRESFAQKDNFHNLSFDIDKPGQFCIIKTTTLLYPKVSNAHVTFASKSVRWSGPFLMTVPTTWVYQERKEGNTMEPGQQPFYLLGLS